MPEEKWSTTPARGMGPYYHHIHGLQLQSVLLCCTEEDARKIVNRVNAGELPAVKDAGLTAIGKSVMPKPKKLTKAAKKLLEEAGCNEIADDYVILGDTDLRILLSDAAIEDLNAQASEQASYK